RAPPLLPPAPPVARGGGTAPPSQHTVSVEQVLGTGFTSRVRGRGARSERERLPARRSGGNPLESRDPFPQSPRLARHFERARVAAGRRRFETSERPRLPDPVPPPLSLLPRCAPEQYPVVGEAGQHRADRRSEDPDPEVVERARDQRGPETANRLRRRTRHRASREQP